MPAKAKPRAHRVVSRRRSKPVRVKDSFSNQEFRYLVEHCSELEQYRGEWLLLDGYGLAAHSSDFAAIKALIAQRGIRSPFIHYVPLEDESVYINV
jgi:hypothetical protein